MTQTTAIPPLMPVFEQPVPDADRLRWKLSGGWATVITSAVLLLVGLGLTFAVLFSLYRDHQYRTEGQIVDGVVVNRRISTSRDSKGRVSTYHYVRYTFTDAAGRPHETEESVSGEFYYSTRMLGTQPVEYLASDATINRLQRHRDHVSKWVMGSIAGVLLLIAYFVFFGSRRSARRRVGVLFHGQATPGQIVVSEQRGRGKNRRHVLQYRYLDLNGREQTSKDVNVASKVMHRFPRGTVITVLIDPADPRRPEPDLYGVRQLPQF